MRLRLLLAAMALLTVPALEVWVLILLTRRLGLGPAVAILALSGLVGIWLARWQGWRAMVRVQGELAAGRLPSGALLDGVLILLAGLLLIFPGLLTDAVAFLLLLPPARSLIRRGLHRWLVRHGLGQATAAASSPGARPAADGGMVEGRAVSVEDAEPPRPAGPGEGGSRHLPGPG